MTDKDKIIRVFALGEKITWARKDIGRTNGTLAAETGIRFSDLLRFQRGTQKPTMSELVKIAEALKRDVDWFLRNDEPKPEVFVR
jgi:transcriptional regulator with XRE-family HTH domain